MREVTVSRILNPFIWIDAACLSSWLGATIMEFLAFLVVEPKSLPFRAKVQSLGRYVLPASLRPISNEF